MPSRRSSFSVQISEVPAERLRVLYILGVFLGRRGALERAGLSAVALRPLSIRIITAWEAQSRIYFSYLFIRAWDFLYFLAKFRKGTKKGISRIRTCQSVWPAKVNVAPES